MSAVDLPLLTDGLQAEREQGITIDVAYRYFSTAGANSSSPTPPATSSTPATWSPPPSTANLAIILIDARKGVLTRPAATYLASLVGIPTWWSRSTRWTWSTTTRAVFERIKGNTSNSPPSSASGTSASSRSRRWRAT